jgi:hypothetical protein
VTTKSRAGSSGSQSRKEATLPTPPLGNELKSLFWHARHNAQVTAYAGSFYVNSVGSGPTSMCWPRNGVHSTGDNLRHSSKLGSKDTLGIYSRNKKDKVSYVCYWIA